VSVFCLDLNFLNQRHAIASSAVPYSNGVVLVDCGPGSTLEALEAALIVNGLDIHNVTHVLLTHIHLDHAGVQLAGSPGRERIFSFIRLVPHTYSTPKDS
jgi:glyoxylase-like metal-dependent hydrolase (beta-lactamase superfamily II)